MKKNSFDQLPVVDEKKIMGIITLGNILSKMASGKANKDALVDSIMFKFNNASKYVPMTMDTPLRDLSRFFDKHSAAIITEHDNIIGITTKIDLIDWMVNK